MDMGLCTVAVKYTPELIRSRVLSSPLSTLKLLARGWEVTSSLGVYAAGLALDSAFETDGPDRVKLRASQLRCVSLPALTDNEESSRARRLFPKLTSSPTSCPMNASSSFSSLVFATVATALHRLASPDGGTECAQYDMSTDGCIQQRATHKRRACMRMRGREMLSRLGPSFIKAGQVLANRPDVLRADYMTELCILQDNVPAFPNPKAFEIIEVKSLPSPPPPPPPASRRRSSSSVFGS